MTDNDNQNNPDNLPESTFWTRIDDIMWSDCDSCRAIRLGIAIGSFVYPTVIIIGILILG